MSCNTPVNSRFLGPNQAETPIIIPAKRRMKKIGYGTGVNVYSMVRSPRNGTERSPWAVKKVNKRFYDSDYEKRLNEEASILKHLNHPHIVGFRAFGKSADGVKCLAMEECQKSLGDLLEETQAPLPAASILKVCVDIAKALDYLHNEQFILHGDVKSYNILIKGNFEIAKLCDFGVSQPLDKNGINVKGNYIGTPLWTAPEALPTGDGPISHKADMFAFGMTIFEMLTAQPPHTSTEELNSTIEDEELEDIAIYNSKLGTRPDLPPLHETYGDVINLFNWCTERDLQSRASAKEVVNYLEKLCQVPF